METIAKTSKYKVAVCLDLTSTKGARVLASKNKISQKRKTYFGYSRTRGLNNWV